MARTPQDVTDTELSILHALWGEGPATIRRLTDGLYPGGGTSHYATVQKLLERLEAKGLVRRDRAGPAHTFAAAVRRLRPGAGVARVLVAGGAAQAAAPAAGVGAAGRARRPEHECAAPGGGDRSRRFARGRGGPGSASRPPRRGIPAPGGILPRR